MNRAYHAIFTQDYEKSKHFLMLARRLAKAFHNADREALANTELGRVYELNFERDAALHYHRKALDYYSRIGHQSLQPWLHNEIAALEMRQGRPHQALPHIKEAFRLYSLTGAAQSQAAAGNALGDTHFALKRYDLAQKSYTEVIRLS
jgi:tetratricopeptide (TPR) repeat protein